MIPRCVNAYHVAAMNAKTARWYTATSATTTTTVRNINTVHDLCSCVAVRAAGVSACRAVFCGSPLASFASFALCRPVALHAVGDSLALCRRHPPAASPHRFARVVRRVGNLLGRADRFHRDRDRDQVAAVAPVALVEFHAVGD